MVRLTRAQQQARTRAAVVAAARQEFVEYGYTPAKVDRIAERAELTRGAVYSNFPSKRALYLSVLLDLVESAGPVAEPPHPPASAGEALGAFARAWLERLPLVEDTAAGGRLHLRSLVGVVEDDPGRAVLAQLAHLEALLLAVGLEACGPGGAAARRVRLAELALTLLGGSGFLAETAPGFGDPFDRARACAHLAGLDLADTWAPAHLPYVRPAAPCRDPWEPPAGLVDQITGEPIDLGADGVVAVLGARRLGAAEEALRSARPGEQAAVVVVTDDPAETGALVRLRITDLAACLRRVFPPETWRPLRLAVADAAPVAAALGLPAAGDDTEAAVRVHAGALVARAQGRGAAHAAATAAPDPAPRSRKATP
ncbi:TetR/AcrR family transcriptional regulator [Streptomonospora sp. S1-112]|uniref:TetR/AcrR family transcriptional regulator n=1 Tax=Streptomonospora mangrovi TaxID=2883123 RepID=A0A9X3SFP1_9ACTN|nr:TetR/AcrR family transcriptional regulator [Streptomonospora mangrovi]MDA0563159.1 TetR/AcrR family transcriptional regulator [Streptomonospora mangrovi]